MTVPEFVSWLIPPLTALGVWGMGGHKNWCWWVFIAVNLLSIYAVFSSTDPVYSIIANNLMLLVLNVRGFLKWRGTKRA